VNSQIEIAVSDNGEGIKPDFIPFVFDRFRQADASTTRRHGGLGLGLSIVKQLVEVHGGTVRVDSPGEGKGAIFTVLLPSAVVRASDRSEDGAMESVHPKTGGRIEFECTPVLEGLHILVVDDEQDARELVTAVLETCMATVTAVSSVSEAIAAIKDVRPDILVSDIGMPEEDGYKLLSKVRALSPEEGGRIPAVALTAYARVEDRMKVLSAGFQMHVPKPVEPAELVAVVASLAGWGKA
jgi:CheY-like chemotaxis protein